MLDYIEVKKVFAACGENSPQTIINKLVELGDAWGGAAHRTMILLSL